MGGDVLTIAARISGPEDLWGACRSGEWAGPTPGVCGAFVQTNLVVLPHADAFDFLRFCGRNPKPCPLIEATDPGDPEPKLTAPGADLRTDLPRYRVYRRGELVDEPTDVRDLWRDDFVGFLIGCSFSFEEALLSAGVPVRHVETGKNVPMYRTDVPCTPAGEFSGPLVVSMRPIPAGLVPLAVTTTARVPQVHGVPVHVGDPGAIGIADLDRPDYGEPVEIRPGELPVFWACGVTPQAVALEAAPEIMITHSPGHMFVTRMTNAELLAAG
jgi:uncharacterized protein YcsI (UPF0317 family)